MRLIENPTQLKPGDPLISREGCTYKFVAYVPDAGPDCRLVVMGAATGRVTCRYADGRRYSDKGDDLGDVGLPPEKLTVWVNAYRDDADGVWGGVSESENKANFRAKEFGRLGNKAWPLEIEV